MRALPSTRSSISSIALGAALLWCTVAGAGEPVSTPAPADEVPRHAAGGWPTDSTGDDRKPTRSAEQQAAIDEVASELRRIAKDYGPDSVVLQAKLLMRAMAAGAQGPTEVRVAGPSTSDAGPGHLEIDVETGLFFDEATTTAESRRETVWKEVGAPVLDEMVSFNIEPASLELVFLFDVQKLAAGEAPKPTEDARHEAFRVRLARDLLEKLISDEVVGDAVRERAIFTAAETVARPSAAH